MAALPVLLDLFASPQLHIGFVGIGAVGGVYSAALLKGMAGETRAKVTFMVPEHHVDALEKSGLSVMGDQGVEIFHPDAIVSSPQQISPPIQLMILATKGDDRDQALTFWRPALAGNAWLLSLMNGVNNGAAISQFLPGYRVLDGCVYVGAHLLAPGKVRFEGHVRRLYLGDIHGEPAGLEALCTLFCQGGVDAHMVHPIAAAVWEKFVFVSPVALVTSLWQCGLRDILERPDALALFLELTSEVLTLARAQGVPLAGLDPLSNAAKLAQFEHQTTSSLYRDLQKGHAGEQGVLVQDVLRLADTGHLPMPAYRRAQTRLLQMYHLPQDDS